MRIAVAVLKKKVSSQISTQAGRAPYYLIFNENADIEEVLANPFSRGGGGAGYGVVKMLADRQVDLVIAGKFGENMIEALKERGLLYQEASGEAKNTVLTMKKDL